MGHFLLLSVSDDIQFWDDQSQFDPNESASAWEFTNGASLYPVPKGSSVSMTDLIPRRGYELDNGSNFGEAETDIFTNVNFYKIIDNALSTDLTLWTDVDLRLSEPIYIWTLNYPTRPATLIRSCNGFDGKGHSLFNFKYSHSSGGDHFGFIGTMNGELSNISVNYSWFEVSYPILETRYVGALVGELSAGSITNCFVDVSTLFSSSLRGTSYVGGIAGKVSSAASVTKNIVSYPSNVSISAHEFSTVNFGGITAKNNSGTVKQNYAYGIGILYAGGDGTRYGGYIYQTNSGTNGTPNYYYFPSENMGFNGFNAVGTSASPSSTLWTNMGLSSDDWNLDVPDGEFPTLKKEEYDWASN